MSISSRKIKKLDSKQLEELKKKGSNKGLCCKDCGYLVENVPFNITSVLCGRCVQLISAPPENYKPSIPQEKRPRGWQFMTRYESPTGKLYHKGREVDESFFNVQKVDARSSTPSFKKSVKKTKPERKSKPVTTKKSKPARKTKRTRGS